MTTRALKSQKSFKSRGRQIEGQPEWERRKSTKFKEDEMEEQKGDSDEDIIKAYFDNDNKDRYFNREQVDYYEKEYKPKMEKPPDHRKVYIRK